ncbi:restriction endonuclease subunit S [Litoribrevibacter euphylliae]|uniref:Restriction endonuclease subunit S n=1 Tax=Litoribrevibacter euphylliae TaxID=1834034 RepID=A0ABV7H978_9GAMM
MSKFSLIKLGKLAKGYRGVSYTPEQLLEHKTDTSFVLLRSNNIEGGFLNFIKTQIVPESVVSEEQILVDGDIAVCMSNGSKALVGKSAAYRDIKGRYTVGAFCSLFRPYDSADSAFLSHVFQSSSFRKHIDFILAGSAINNLRNKDVEDYELIDFNSEEKVTIANILDTLDTQIRETEAIIAKLQQVKQGLLHDLLTRGVDENGELRPSYEDAPELYKPSELGLIPKEWNAKSLEEISTIKSGSTPLRAKAEIYFCSEGGFPWVKTMDLNEDVLVRTDEQITQKALDKTSCTLYPKESVLVAMYGGWEQIGRVAMLAKEAATNQAISVLIFKSDDIFPEFVLRSLQFNRHHWKKVAASTRKDPNITKSDVEKFKIAVPDETNEQQHIVKAYREMIDKINAEAMTLDKLLSKKSGLMDDLLTGKVRVTELLKQKQAS